MKLRIALEAITTITGKEKRKRLVMVTVAAIVAAMLPVLLLVYILTHPLQALKAFFSGNELTHVEAINTMSPQHNEGGDFRAAIIGSAFVLSFRRQSPERMAYCLTT